MSVTEHIIERAASQVIASYHSNVHEHAHIIHGWFTLTAECHAHPQNVARDSHSDEQSKFLDPRQLHENVKVVDVQCCSIMSVSNLSPRIPPWERETH